MSSFMHLIFVFLNNYASQSNVSDKLFMNTIVELLEDSLLSLQALSDLSFYTHVTNNIVCN